MTRRTKISLIALIGIAAIGLFFWMRSLASWRPVKIGQMKPGYSVNYISNDNHTALIGTYSTRRNETVLNLDNGSTIDWPETPYPVAHFSQNSPEWGFAFENKMGQGELHARELQSGRLKRTFQWPLPPRQKSPEIMLAPDGKTVSVVDAPHLFQWDIQSGKLLRQVVLKKPVPSTPGSPIRFALSSDGTRLIECAHGRGLIWDSASGKMVQSWPTKAYDYPAFFSPDERVVVYTYLSSTENPPYAFVDTATGKILWNTTDDISESSFYDDEIFILGKTNCEILDNATGRLKRHLPGPCQSDGAIMRVTPDYIYTMNYKGEILRWRAH